MIATCPFRIIRIVAAAAFFLLAARLPFAFQAQTSLPKQANDTVRLMLDWENRSTPGAKVAARELSRTPGDGGTSVAYRFVVSGVPTDQLYTLLAWDPGTDLGDAKPVAYSLRPTPNGLVCGMQGNCTTRCAVGMNCGTLNEPLDPSVVAAKGERKFLVLLSNDGKSSAFFAVTPFPITANHGSCSLSVSRTIKSTLAVIQGDGFAPAEDLSITTGSYDDQHTALTRTDAKGHFNFAVLPFVGGKTSGVARFTAKGKQCAPSVQFDWGTGAMKIQ